jgi:hypothetical protein
MESGAGVGGWRGTRGGRTLIGIVLCGATIVCSASEAAADFYRWVDSKGVEHFSNVPTDLPAGRGVARIPVEPGKVADEEAAAADEGAAARENAAAGGAGDGAAAGTAGSTVGRTRAEASLARDSLEKEYRKVTARIDAIDKELKELATARTRWAHGENPATGDTPATGAADVLSPEEEGLAKERGDLEQQAKDMKKSMADLKGRE